jgi:hypothetical protein
MLHNAKGSKEIIDIAAGTNATRARVHENDGIQIFHGRKRPIPRVYERGKATESWFHLPRDATHSHTRTISSSSAGQGEGGAWIGWRCIGVFVAVTR